MRDTAGLLGLAGFALVGTLVVAGGAPAHADGDPEPAAALAAAPVVEASPPVIEFVIPEVPLKALTSVPFTAGDLQGFVVRVGQAPVLTPAVDGNRVFAGDSMHMKAFGSLDGKRLWSSRVDDAQPTAPAVSSGHVYFNTQSCTLYGIEASSGGRDWSKLVANSVSSTPAILGDRVYVTGPSNEGGFKLEAYDRKGGNLAFRVPLPADAITAPVASGDRIFLALADGSVSAFDRDGKQVWTRSVDAVAAPWPTPERVLVACGDPVNPTLVGLDRRTGTPDERGVATPRDDAKPDGGKKTMVGGGAGPKGGAGGKPGPKVAPPASPGEGLGGGPFGRGRGAPPIPPPPAGGTGSGSVGLGSTFGYEGPRPCVLGDIVAMGAGTDLVLRGAAGGEPRRVSMGAEPAGAPVAAGTMFIQATKDGRVLGVDPATGRIRFQVKLTRGGQPVSLSASPAVWRGRAYFGTPDGCLVAFDLPDASADGWPMWGGSPTRSK